MTTKYQQAVDSKNVSLYDCHGVCIISMLQKGQFNNILIMHSVVFGTNN